MESLTNKASKLCLFLQVELKLFTLRGHFVVRKRSVMPKANSGRRGGERFSREGYSFKVDLNGQSFTTKHFVSLNDDIAKNLPTWQCQPLQRVEGGISCIIEGRPMKEMRFRAMMETSRRGERDTVPSFRGGWPLIDSDDSIACWRAQEQSSVLYPAFFYSEMNKRESPVFLFANLNGSWKQEEIHIFVSFFRNQGWIVQKLRDAEKPCCIM
jgi:hypothetical protein